MSSIKLVTFDATNTLLRFKIPPWEYYSIVAKDYGFTGTSDVLKAQMKTSFKLMEQKHPIFGRNDVTWENWWRELVKLTFKGQLPANADVGKIANKLIDEFKTTKCWTTADGTKQLLDLLTKNKIGIGVISNFDPRLTDILQNISLYKRFDFITTSYEVGYSKPDKRIFFSAMEAHRESVKPSECLHIGDDLDKDYRGAISAGWHAILLSTSVNDTQANPSHVFKSIQDLMSALEQNRIRLQCM